MTHKVVAIVSGGLDSTTMVYSLLNAGYKVDCVAFDYGQRHKKELVFARSTAIQLDLKFDVVDLSGLSRLISNSALTSNSGCVCGPWHPDADGPLCECPEHGDDEHRIAIPDGHYAEENMKLTVVPNRNMIMISIAAGIAVNRNADMIAIGVHAGDHFVYPDCRSPFIYAANAAVVLGNEGFGAIKKQQEGCLVDRFIYAPFLQSTKAEIAYQALRLDVPLHMTWSCYKGGENHCGRCGTCVERLEAIDEALFRFGNNGHIAFDSTIYDDVEYWRVALANRKKQNV